MKTTINYLELGNDFQNVEKKANRAIQLTPRSYPNILNNVLKNQEKKLASESTKKEEPEVKLEDFGSDHLDKAEKIVARVEDRVDIMVIDNDYYDKIEVVDQRPLRLLPKMFENINDVYNFVSKKNPIDKVAFSNENHLSDNIQVSDFSSENDSQYISAETMFGKSFEQKLENNLNNIVEESIENVDDYKFPEEEKGADNMEIKSFVEPESVSNSVKLNTNLDLNELKENYINITNRVKQQQDALLRKEQEKQDIISERIKAEQAKQEAMNKLIEKTKMEQQLLSETMEKETEISKEIEEENRSVQNINKDTNEILAMISDNSSSDMFSEESTMKRAV